MIAGIVGKVRRACLTVFRPRYVRKQIQRRQGTCMQCGKCCRLLYRCPFLTRENTCRIYHLPRPGNCKIFPIDRRDLREVDGVCGFSFDEDSNLADNNRSRKRSKRNKD